MTLHRKTEWKVQYVSGCLLSLLAHVYVCHVHQHVHVNIQIDVHVCRGVPGVQLMVGPFGARSAPKNFLTYNYIH